MLSHNRWSRALLVLSALVSLELAEMGSSYGSLSAQSADASRFAEAYRLLQDCLMAQADLLAPRNFREGLKHFRRAGKVFDGGVDVFRAQNDLQTAMSFFASSLRDAELARVSFSVAIGARHDAENAGAPRFAVQEWNGGERKLGQAAERLQRGDTKAAQKKSQEALALYLDAERKALRRSNVLTRVGFFNRQRTTEPQ